MIPFLGFAPDADPTTPGVLTDCQNLIPYEAGLRGAPTPIPVPFPALAAPCRGAAIATLLGGTRRMFAGTQTGLFEQAGGVWVDRSKVGGYVGSTESRWSMCQFGDSTIASNYADPMQLSIAAGFSDIAGAPKAKIVISVSNNFVLALATDDATYGDSPDRWRCCAQNNQNDWVPNVATGANTGRLIATEGPITAGLPLGDKAIVYKARAVFLGQYVGGAETWRFFPVPGSEAGAVGQEAVCDIGGAHFIVGEDDFYLFDGTIPKPVGLGVVRQYWAANSSPTFRYRTIATYDKQNGVVRVHFPSTTSLGALDRCLVFHIKRNLWGRADAVIQAPLNYIAPGVTIDGLDAYSPTIDGLPDVPLDSQFWAGGGQTAAYFDASNQLVSLSGETQDSSLTTGDYGDDDAVTMIDRVRVRFLRSPVTATATGLYKFNEGDVLVTGPAVPIHDGKFDLRQSGRFHRIRLDMTGSHRVTGLAVKYISVGER